VAFLQKLKGAGKSPPRVGVSEIIHSWVGAVCGVSAVAYVSAEFLHGTDYTLIIGSFGASAVLIYGAINSPLAQPRNFVGGHVLSACVGVASWQLIHPEWIAAAVAVATAIAVMHLTKTLHPPGGATALIAVIGSAKIHALGWMYVLVPVASGVLLMLMIALVCNNIPRNRQYPQFWW